MYLLTCLRVAMTMGRAGGNRLLWFLVTLLATALPAMIVLWRRRMRQVGSSQRPGPVAGPGPDRPPDSQVRLCPHCGQLLHPEELSGFGPVRCATCHSLIQEDQT
jgi:hypothetical protein